MQTEETNLAKKKNVLYFVPTFPVLTETFIEREISKLIEFGNLNITVFSLQKGNGVISSNIEGHVVYERIGLKECFGAFFSYIIGDFKKVKKAHDLIKGKDKQPYLSLVSKNKIRRSRLIVFLKALAYTRLFEKYEPDHLYAHFLSEPSTMIMVAAKILDIPFSISAHAKDIFVEGSLIPIKAREAKFISVCSGNSWREVIDYANQTKSSKNVQLIFHGYNPQNLETNKKINRSEVPHILCIGRLVDKKGHRFLIEASKVLKNRGVAHKINIIGPGDTDKLNEYNSLIRDLGLENNVSIIGDGKGLPHKDIITYLNSSDLMVLPFLEPDDGDVDGVPNVLVEAAFAMLPVVGTRAGSLSDLLTPQTGLVIPERDPNAIADAVQYLIFNRETAEELAKAAYRDAIKKFDINLNVREIENLILL